MLSTMIIELLNSDPFDVDLIEQLKAINRPVKNFF